MKAYGASMAKLYFEAHGAPKAPTWKSIKTCISVTLMLNCMRSCRGGEATPIERLWNAHGTPMEALWNAQYVTS